jgi:hypothetical protein
MPAAAWGAMFALVHLYWLLGGTAGLPVGMSLFSNVPLLIIEVVAIPLSVLAAIVALSLASGWRLRFGRRLLLAAAWGVSALLIVHALPSVTDWIALALGHRAFDDFAATERFVTFLYEPWFMTGGILFALTALGFQGGTR